jgi:hypothetical protein
MAGGGGNSLRTTSGLSVQKLGLLLHRLSQDPSSPFNRCPLPQLSQTQREQPPAPASTSSHISQHATRRRAQKLFSFGIHRFPGPYVAACTQPLCGFNWLASPWAILPKALQNTEKEMSILVQYGKFIKMC